MTDAAYADELRMRVALYEREVGRFERAERFWLKVTIGLGVLAFLLISFASYATVRARQDHPHLPTPNRVTTCPPAHAMVAYICVPTK
jgi:hypothetical protein